MLVGLSRLFHLKPCMSSFVAFESRWLSLAEHSHSIFALIVSLLCAGEDLLSSSGDVDEGCQWEVQTDEGWDLYWDSQAYSGRGRHSPLVGRVECAYRDRNHFRKSLATSTEAKETRLERRSGGRKGTGGGNSLRARILRRG
jgi:hypothetical protein